MLAGVILAGGEGKRWGGPKAWARLPDGTTFLARCALTLREAGASPVVATLPAHSAEPGVAGVECLVLPEPGLDMFASLRIGLRRLCESRVWRAAAVLPVDHPLVGFETVVRIAGATATAAAPVFRGKHGHPVCLGRALAEAIVDGSASGSTLREVLSGVHRVEVVVDDPGVVANCNTPDALSRALASIHPDS